MNDALGGKPRRQSKPLFELDLRDDSEYVFNYIRTQVRRFLQEVEPVGSVVNRVCRVECGYEYSQSGWVMVYFDTRPEATSGGHWTLFIDKHYIERTHWRKASSANMSGPVSIIDHEGKGHLIPERSNIEMSIAIGLMLKAVLLRARDEGLFMQLSLAPICKFGVEDFDGHFGWPVYGVHDDDVFVTRLPLTD